MDEEFTDDSGVSTGLAEEEFQKQQQKHETTIELTSSVEGLISIISNELEHGSGFVDLSTHPSIRDRFFKKLYKLLACYALHASGENNTVCMLDQADWLGTVASMECTLHEYQENPVLKNYRVIK